MAITLTQDKLVQAVCNRVDDSPANTSVTDWLNSGQNVMANKVGAIFPQLDPNNSSSQFVFDDKWAEIPVIYACARFKQADLMYPDADRYMQQFNDLLKDFVARYNLPEQYMDSPQAQQYTATAGQTDFTITKESFDPRFGNLRVYVNGNLAQFNTSDNAVSSTVAQAYDRAALVVPYTFTLTTACVGGEYVTAVWDMNTELEFPPYSFWTRW